MIIPRHGCCPQAMGIQLAVATRCLAHAIQANLGLGEVHVEQIEATIVEAYNQEIQCPGQKPPKVMPPEPVAQSFSM